MPLVPEIGRYAGVLGKKRNRWESGNLLLSVVSSGGQPDAAQRTLSRFRDALAVEATDDVFAVFVENSLRQANGGQSAPPPSAARDAAWRPTSSQGSTPAERFQEDLAAVIDLKNRLTRRQWTVLVEALLRLGLGMHVLWLLRFNDSLWTLLVRTLELEEAPTWEEVNTWCWMNHGSNEPLLELGQDAIPRLRAGLQQYAQARLGINLILHGLDDARASWTDPIGLSGSGANDDPVTSVVRFLEHVATNARDLQQQITAQLGAEPLRDRVAILAEANPRLLSAQSGFTKNLFEFLRYSLGQMQPLNREMLPYDQGYLLYKNGRGPRSPWLVQPGPALTILMIHCCCATRGSVPSSMDDLQEYLAQYGIHAPSGELRGGQVRRDLERLGLVVDSPDAGGGRLLVKPF